MWGLGCASPATSRLPFLCRVSHRRPFIAETGFTAALLRNYSTVGKKVSIPLYAAGIVLERLKKVAHPLKNTDVGCEA